MLKNFNVKNLINQKTNTMFISLDYKKAIF